MLSLSYMEFVEMKFSVPKMKCGGCVETVETTLRKLDANAPIKIDLASKQVEFDGDIAQDVVFSALTAAGYPPVIAQ